jgi:hypothetical protein
MSLTQRRRRRWKAADLCRGQSAGHIEHFRSSLEQGRPVHHGVVLHQVHVVLRSRPQEVPQLQMFGTRLLQHLKYMLQRMQKDTN